MKLISTLFFLCAGFSATLIGGESGVLESAILKQLADYSKIENLYLKLHVVNSDFTASKDTVRKDSSFVFEYWKKSSNYRVSLFLKNQETQTPLVYNAYDGTYYQHWSSHDPGMIQFTKVPIPTTWQETYDITLKWLFFIMADSEEKALLAGGPTWDYEKIKNAALSLLRDSQKLTETKDSVVYRVLNSDIVYDIQMQKTGSLLPNEIITKNKTGKMLGSYQVDKIASLGIQYPEISESIHYEDGKPAFKLTYKVLSITTNDKDFDDSVFYLDVSGARQIFDRDKLKMIKVPQ